ncbi:hypothetical protein [Legionella fairfieldensis]|uniref:hypothetical protein n=1 Tax=Legionella fairfieldensis TaxID=45064 RepID=UPI00048F9942|nr:hypothetical protein [Legionella fairfieldensis]
MPGEINNPAKVRIDNPGGGDCGFYAFAIGLIDLIQNEYQSGGVSPTYDQWVQEGLEDIQLDDLLAINLYQLHLSPRNDQKRMLSALQMSLRHVVVNTQRQSLLAALQSQEKSPFLSKIEGEVVFNKFMQLVLLVKNSINELPTEAKFNELVFDNNVMKLARETSRSLRLALTSNESLTSNEYCDELLVNASLEGVPSKEWDKLISCSISPEKIADIVQITKEIDTQINKKVAEKIANITFVNEEEKRAVFARERELFPVQKRKDMIADKVKFRLDERIQREHIKDIFLKDTIVKGELNPHSVILKGMDQIAIKGKWWATHENLTLLAAKFKVNLVVEGPMNGQRLNNGTLLAIPSIHLTNHNNVHWTTTVSHLSRPPAVVSSSLPEKGMKYLTDKDNSTFEPPENESGKDKNLNLSKKVEQVINYSAKAQILEHKVEQYKAHLRELIDASLTQGLFNNIHTRIAVNAIDEAKAITNEKGEIVETDESFATRLQEAELRRVGLK